MEKYEISVIFGCVRITEHVYLRSARYMLYARFLLGLLFNPEDGKNMFLRNVG
jgi:hypothetical protein